MARTKTSAPPAPPEEGTAFDFEKSMQELEAVVARLEQGDIPLEEALSTFERGVTLTRACQRALQLAEQKVEMLTTQGDAGEQLTPFDEDTGDPE